MKRNYIYNLSSRDFSTIQNSHLWIKIGGMNGGGEECPGRCTPWGVKVYRYYTAPLGWKGLAEKEWIFAEHEKKELTIQQV